MAILPPNLGEVSGPREGYQDFAKTLPRWVAPANVSGVGIEA
jgi:hypothetical protein